MQVYSSRFLYLPPVTAGRALSGIPVAHDKASFSKAAFGSEEAVPKTIIRKNVMHLKNGEKLSLLPCRKEDLAEAIIFIMRVNAQENGLPGLQYWSETFLKSVADSAEEDFQSPRKVFYLAKDDKGRIEALISCMPYSGESFDSVLPPGSAFRGKQNPDSTKIAEVLDFYVDKRLWGQGVGRILWRKAEEELKEKGFSALLLSTNESHPIAHQAYTHLGCQDIGTYMAQYGGRTNINKVFYKDLR